jgi:hypothetical protein
VTGGRPAPPEPYTAPCMAPPSPRQIAARQRVEQLIRLAAPFLDAVLLAGDRISRAVDRSDDEPLPAIRYPTEARPLRRPATD